MVLSKVRVDAIIKLRALGMTVAETARTLGVSTQTVYDHTVPGHYEGRKKRTRDYYRRTLLATGPSRKKPVILKNLNKRPYPGKCELCGVAREKWLYYHHWDPDNPSLGVWLCRACHIVAEVMDNPRYRGLAAKYLRLREKIRAEYFQNKHLED